MMLGTPIGRHLNNAVGEKGSAVLFWSVMAAYTARIAVALG